MGYISMKGFRECIPKKYLAWACKPPKGTYIINKLYQREELDYLKFNCKYFGTKEYITPDELATVKVTDHITYKYIVENCKVTDDKNSIVICGTVGELYIISYERLCKEFKLSRSSKLYNVADVINKYTQKVGNETLLPWVRIVNNGLDNTKGKVIHAKFIPESNMGTLSMNSGRQISYNQPDVKHGKGDFLTCEIDKNTGNLKLNTLRVINGLVFANTFDGRSWRGSTVISCRIGRDKPTEMFEPRSNDADATLGEAVNYYISGGAKNINGYLANSCNCEDNTVKRYVTTLVNRANRAINPKNTIVYRGTKLEWLIGHIEFKNGKLHHYKGVKINLGKGFISASTIKEAADKSIGYIKDYDGAEYNLVMHIRVKKGLRLLDIRSMNKHKVESEMLLPPNTQVVVDTLKQLRTSGDKELYEMVCTVV